ncbi:anti-sigma factor family protein [Amycolatopsis sp. H20-H5]|uniref:anti-sigma factor family protein n=1 Tax=Amycolatopsis sp. H20-H5 TaxID=3046309 RepID=UPI002DBB62CA|nr:zf-HC2 domain-containing protein [Amycolatopsis sp. H20-H5]MEC3974081.1 zf-HC2 domain-containing protein [Amycolatopsis sp. H20-H5]
MSAVEHGHARLGAYVLGALDSAEATEFERHLVTCAECRREVYELGQLRAELDEVPPEAFLDGPPEGGELLLQRTLRRVRAEEPRKSRFLAVAGAAALVVVALGAGILVGRQTAPSNVALPPPSTSAPLPGKDLKAIDDATGAQLAVRLTPAAGWVKLHLSVEGVREGEKCQVLVVSKSGESVVAGSWLVSAKGEREGTGLDGSALIAPDEVKSVDVVTMDGRKLVSATA